VIGTTDDPEIWAGWIGEYFQHQFWTNPSRIALGDDKWGWHVCLLV